jgi:hypothetical protein
MLENLDKIDWSKLNHAYGSAEDVPNLIRQLTSSDRNIRNATYEKLCSNIYHQGTLYQATSYAIPFLTELLQTSGVEDKHLLLGYLTAIADASSYNPAHESLTMFHEWIKPTERQQRRQSKLHWVSKAYTAIELIIGMVRKEFITGEHYYDDIVSIATVCEVFYRLGVEQGVVPLTQCLQTVTDNGYAITIADALLDLTFGENNQKVVDLNDWQRQALTAVVNCEVLWELEINLYKVYGLPNARTKLKDLLA